MVQSQTQTHTPIIGYLLWLFGFLIYLLTCGIFGLGYIYDFWTLNDQVSLLNGSGPT